jgi:hypothetical protein
MSSQAAISAVKKVGKKVGKKVASGLKQFGVLADEQTEEEIKIAVPVDPSAYAVVVASSPAIQEVLLAALRANPAAEEFVSTDRDAAQLLIAAGYHVVEQARVDSAEINLGRDEFASDLAAVDAFLPYFDEPQEYSEDERMILHGGHALEAQYNAAKRTKKFKTVSALASARYVFSGQRLLCRTTADIRAPIRKVLVYNMQITPKYYTATYTDTELEDRVVDRPNNHNYTVLQKFKSPPPIHGRELVATCVWEKLDGGTGFFVCIKSISRPDCPLSPNFVRIHLNVAIKFKSISPILTSVEVIVYNDLKLPLPKWVNTQVVLPQATGTALNMQLFVATFRPANEVNKGDAKELGMILIDRLYALRGDEKLLREKLFKLVSRVAVLRKAQAKYHYVVELLLHVIRNKYGTSGGASCQSHLRKITPNEMEAMGKGLANIIMSNVTGDAAVDEWIRGSLPLQELSAENSWFRPMMEGSAEELLSRANFGVAARAFIGAGFSFFDMASDTFMVFGYFEEGRDEFALALIGMIALNVISQLIVVFCQNRKLKQDRWQTMLSDMLYTVTFVKAGVDAYRVASGAEENEGAMFGTLSEMIYGKYLEMYFVSVAARMRALQFCIRCCKQELLETNTLFSCFCSCQEALPGLCIQVVALVTSKQIRASHIASLLLSVGSAALTATSSSYDLDTAPEKRRRSPDMYGMVPDSGRAVTFAFMFSICSVQLFNKALAMALLYVTNSSWIWRYLAGDMSIYFAQKLLRRDFTMFVPIPGVFGILISVFYRIVGKMLADFSGSLHFRNPYELGGIFFSINLIMTQCSVFGATYLYVEHCKDENKIDADKLWKLVTVSVALWTALFTYFIFNLIDTEYRKTFWSTRTGWQKSCSFFLDNDDDSKRIIVFSDNPTCWKSIAPRVKEWTLLNWGTWSDTKPAWFTPQIISTVPDEFIPPRYLSGLGGAVRERRGSARMSGREVTVRPKFSGRR